MFALAALDEVPATVNLKCDPDLALELRDQYEQVRPGYHMKKKPCNTSRSCTSPTSSCNASRATRMKLSGASVSATSRLPEFPAGARSCCRSKSSCTAVAQLRAESTRVVVWPSACSIAPDNSG